MVSVQEEQPKPKPKRNCTLQGLIYELEIIHPKKKFVETATDAMIQNLVDLEPIVDQIEQKRTEK